MNYTPGPLSIKKAEDSDNPDWAIVDADNRVIGEAFDLVYFDIHRPAKANARLWASAPDLLAERDALRAALEFYADPASWKRSSKQGGWPVAESQAVLKDRGKRARAALDAAEVEINDNEYCEPEGSNICHIRVR